MTRRTLIVAGAIALLVGTVLLLRSGIGTQLVWSVSDQGKLLAPLVVVSALLDSINPCAFAILLITIAVLMGMGAARGRLLKVGGVYIAGIFAAYLAIGLGIFGTLHLFSTPHFMGKVGAVVLIAWGALSIIGELFPAFPVKLRIPQAAHHRMAVLMERATIPAAFGLGALVGLCEFPCTGGPYLMVLGLLHDSATYLKGIGYLLLYNGVFVLPLVVLLFLAGDPAVLGKLQAWRNTNARRMRLWGGAAMLALGVLIYFL